MTFEELLSQSLAASVFPDVRACAGAVVVRYCSHYHEIGALCAGCQVRLGEHIAGEAWRRTIVRNRAVLAPREADRETL